MVLFRRPQWGRVQTGPAREVIDAVESSGLFDPVWYAHRYPDVAKFRRGTLVHFCMYGLKELRDPSPYVSPSAYLRRHPRARTDSRPALLHALDTLPAEEREQAWMPDDDASLEYLIQKHGLFDEAWYVARYRDVSRAGGEPIQHFMRHGAHEFRDPGPAFDTDYYRNAHPDYQDLGRTPIEHFVRFGLRHGYPGVGLAGYARWIADFDTLREDDFDRIRADYLRTSRPVAVFHVLDAEACERIEVIVRAWDGQIGVDWAVRFLRGGDLSDDAWERCASSVKSHAKTSVVDGEDLTDLKPGAFLLLCAGACLVRPHAAYAMAQTLAHAGLDAVYADHDHLDEAGVRTRPVFKPDMSPEFMRRSPYAGTLVATVLREQHRPAVVRTLAAARGNGAAEALASYLLGLPPDKVGRVPFVLSHRFDDQAPEAEWYEPVPDPKRKAFADHAAPVHDLPSVTVVIPTRNRGDLLRECIDSIVTRTDYPAALFDIVVVDNGSDEDDTLAYFAEVETGSRVRIVPSPGPFNFSTICNDGAARAEGDVIVFLNNDMTVRQPDWMRKLVGHARRLETGIVGAQLLYPDGTVQHGGVVLGVQGLGAHRLVGRTDEQAALVDCTREMIAVTGACLAVRRAVFAKLGGFDPILQIAFNDVKLCADAHEAGYRNIYVGEPLLYHHESKSRGFDDSRLKLHRNAREAIYMRERYGDLFRNDPSYSPNLSLQVVGKLASSPRVVRPWRRSPSGRKMILLSRVHNLGSGVAAALEQQALALRERGWDVTVGGRIGKRDRPYAGFRRVDLRTAEAAAAHVMAEGIDCVIAHTPPFFSITRYMGIRPLVYFTDYGEPMPHLFPDWRMREDVDWEKRFCAPLARRVFTISQTIARHQYRRDAMVIRLGNSHLASWSRDWLDRRRALRKKLGFEGRFVVLNVCRFGPGERYYKGISRYGEVASDMPYLYPDLAGQVRFILAGRGDEDDVAAVEAIGLTAFANVSDEEMAELYAASDLYMNLSEWEGYNLGIGQALAMGLDVIASDIEAHREFDIERCNSVPDLCTAVAKRHATWSEGAPDRHPSVEGWTSPMTQLATVIEGDIDQAVDPWTRF